MITYIYTNTMGLTPHIYICIYIETSLVLLHKFVYACKLNATTYLFKVKIMLKRFISIAV